MARGLCCSHYRQKHIKGRELRPLKVRAEQRDGEKRCTECQAWYAATERDLCPPCHKRRRRKLRYGLTDDELAALLAQTTCDACGDELVGEHQIDHCHASGEVRGVLCRYCNLALGYLNDDPDRIRALAEYAARHRLRAVS